jgi:acetyl-CoA carboxylase biotin carboxyl carrier protein
VSNPLDSLTNAQVRQIIALVESLDRSSFDYLQVSLGDLRITLGKEAPPASGSTASAPPAAPTRPAPGRSPGSEAAPPEEVSTPLPAVPEPAAQSTGQPSESTEGTVAVLAPLMGLFYSQPQPEAPPFVKVGDPVTAEATVGLIEVMKLFSPVVAGIDGVVAEICVQDGQLVEYQQVLFRIRPSGARAVPGSVESSIA